MKIEIDGSPVNTTQPIEQSSNEQLVDYIKNGSNFQALLAIPTLADSLEENGELLEISTKENKRFFSGIYVKDVEEEYIGDVNAQIPRLHGGKVGTIVFRGNIGEVSGLRGGIIYVDGNVNRIREGNGLVYVNGSVNIIEDVQSAIVVVAGKVGKISQRQRSGGGLGLYITPSPFIFTSHTPEFIEPDLIQYGQNRLIPETTKVAINPSFVVHESQLRGWDPEKVKEQALDLCNDRINVYLKSLQQLAGGVITPQGMADFAKYHMFGYTSGWTNGYYAHPSGPSD